MPQFVIFAMFAFAACMCCVLVALLWCFRRVCCPRTLQSRLPSWNKVRHVHEQEIYGELDNEDDDAAQPQRRRPNPKTGLTAGETRNSLRTRYEQLGLQPNF